MKKQLEHDYLVEDIDDDDIIEDWQYELSTDLAHNFLEGEILPKVEEFDLSNAEEAYVTGVTTYALFMKLIPILASYGFSQGDLHDTIDGSYGIESGVTIH